MIDIVKVMDSENFCAYIVNDNKTNSNETDHLADIKIPQSFVNTVPYENLIPLIRLQVAAETGNL